MELTINEKTYTLKYSFRSLIIYENIAGKSFQPQNLTDILVFFYSCLLASGHDAALSWDDFMDYIDDNPESVNDFSDWLTAQFTKNNVLTPDTEVKETKKKKK